MTGVRISALPPVINATLADIFPVVQSGVTSKETLAQAFALILSQTILNFAGNPNGLVAGTVYQLLWDTTDMTLWICTTTGNAATAVWTMVTSGGGGLITPPFGGTGVASPPAHTLPVAEGAANFNFLGPLTNGQLLIGSTGLDPVPNTITAGTNVTVSNAAGTITISSSGGAGFTWTDVAGVSHALLSFNGYVSDNAGLVTFTLPATSALGDPIEILCRQGSFTVVLNPGQKIVYGTSTTTVTTGSITTTNPGDCIRMICTVANTEWTIVSSQGTFTVV